MQLWPVYTIARIVWMMCLAALASLLGHEDHWHIVLATSGEHEGESLLPTHTHTHTHSKCCSLCSAECPPHGNRFIHVGRDCYNRMGSPPRGLAGVCCTLQRSAFMTCQLAPVCVQPGRAAQLRHPALR